MNHVRSNERDFDFEKIIPMPEYIYRGPLRKEEEELYGKNNWYDWSIENWGTKWNSEGAVIDGDCITFETAWSPCSPVIETLAKQYPEAIFRYQYYETGVAFCGVEEYHNGELTYMLSGDYAENPAWELDDEDAEEYCISDDLYPIPADKECSFLEDFQPLVEAVEEDGSIVKQGKLFYREYGNGRIVKKIDATVEYKEEEPRWWL